ncbi:hypothetical protein D2T31_16525 [Sinirhodobacter populi]|uniref:Uncharacterized protein n=1 Tax=Paenirhodobacter populi TaxID=2306993 RepID=A0A443K3W7_9RHOB|nr:hypothetical protein D2T31_16525 [Sinirhodobacter populi]
MPPISAPVAESIAPPRRREVSPIAAPATVPSKAPSTVDCPQPAFGGGMQPASADTSAPAVSRQEVLPMRRGLNLKVAICPPLENEDSFNAGYAAFLRRRR